MRYLATAMEVRARTKSGPAVILDSQSSPCRYARAGPLLQSAANGSQLIGPQPHTSEAILCYLHGRSTPCKQMYQTDVIAEAYNGTKTAEGRDSITDITDI